MELRESSSPVPAHTCIVSLGAMARSPIEMTRSLSKTGRKVMPPFVVFQIPPAAAATKNVRDGLGIPSMSVMRPPMIAGPIERQRAFASTTESMAVPCAYAVVANPSVRAAKASAHFPGIGLLALLGVTLASMGELQTLLAELIRQLHEEPVRHPAQRLRRRRRLRQSRPIPEERHGSRRRFV